MQLSCSSPRARTPIRSPCMIMLLVIILQNQAAVQTCLLVASLVPAHGHPAVRAGEMPGHPPPPPPSSPELAVADKQGRSRQPKECGPQFGLASCISLLCRETLPRFETWRQTEANGGSWKPAFAVLAWHRRRPGPRLFGCDASSAPVLRDLGATWVHLGCTLDALEELWPAR